MESEQEGSRNNESVVGLTNMLQSALSFKDIKIHLLFTMCEHEACRKNVLKKCVTMNTYFQYFTLCYKCHRGLIMVLHCSMLARSLQRLEMYLIFGKKFF